MGKLRVVCKNSDRYLWIWILIIHAGVLLTASIGTIITIAIEVRIRR